MGPATSSDTGLELLRPLCPLCLELYLKLFTASRVITQDLPEEEIFHQAHLLSIKMIGIIFLCERTTCFAESLSGTTLPSQLS